VIFGALLLIITAVFVTALVHKVGLVAAGTARTHPVLSSSPILANRATAWLALAGVTEAASAIGLWIAPVPALAALLGLLGAYSVTLANLDETQDCDCFGPYAPATDRGGALRRNAMLAGAVVVALLLAIQGGEPTMHPLTVAVGLLIVAPFAGSLALRHIVDVERDDRASRI
jgi:hypothetical protein